MKSRGFVIIKVLLVLLILISSFAGCSGRKTEVVEDSSRSESGSAPVEQKQKESYGEEETNYDEKLDNGYTDNQVISDRKMIQTKYYIIETLEFDKTATSVEALVNKYLGYIESSQVSGRTLYYDDYYSTRSAYYTMRIPAKSLNIFSGELEALGNVIEESVSKEDVTTQLVDVEARVKSLEVQEERLLELVQTGGQLKDILEIETQLSDVRYQIESYKATMNNLENRVNYGTIQLELREVIKETDQAKPAITIGQRISQGFMRSLTNIKDFFVNFFIVIIIALPYLALWALFIGLIFVIIKRIINKNQRKRDNRVIIEPEKSNDLEKNKKDIE